jgi:ABC-type antimicrobial peptide transport system permease subunit
MRWFATGDLVTMILREGAGLAAAGVVLGLLGSWALTRFFSDMLFGIEPVDLPTFPALSAAVLLISVAASLAPALRATRVDPMEALREE